MKIDGYEVYNPKEPVWEVQVYLSTEVSAYFEKEGRKGQRNYQHVLKAKQTLTALKRLGPARVFGSANYKSEGKFPSGRSNGAKQSVEEAKSDQVRVYGGPVSIGGQTVYFFVKAVTKKSDKADQDLLKSVAKILGGLFDAGKR